ESESSAPHEGRLAEKPPQLILVESHRWGIGSPGAKPGYVHPAHIDRENPAAAGDPLHLACHREPHFVVEDRRQACELRDKVELAVAVGQCGAAACTQVQCWVATAALGDPLLHQVDSMRLAGAVLLEPVKEV